MLYFWAPATCTLLSPDSSMLAAMSDEVILTLARKSEHSRRDVLFLFDTWNFYHFYTDKYPNVLKHGVISGSTDSSAEHLTKHL